AARPAREIKHRVRFRLCAEGGQDDDPQRDFATSLRRTVFIDFILSALHVLAPARQPARFELQSRRRGGLVLGRSKLTGGTKQGQQQATTSAVDHQSRIHSVRLPHGKGSCTTITTVQVPTRSAV